MKSSKFVLASIATIVTLSANFASAASFSEAPEFRSGMSTLTRTQVTSAIMGAGMASEATVISAAKSTLSREEVAKQAREHLNLNYRFNELTASQSK
jgi:hypothetical protein